MNDSIQDRHLLCGGILVGWEAIGIWRGSLVRQDMFHEHFWLGAVSWTYIILNIHSIPPDNEHRFSPPNDWNQHHGFLSSLSVLALLVSCTLRTLRELLLPSVASLRFSYLWFLVASRCFCRTLLPCLMVGLLLSRASSLVNGSVAVSGYRRSSSHGGPAAWYCTPSWHHRSVRSASRKVVILLRSC